MSGQLEGIGAQLQDKNGNITIAKLIPGSPAWKNGEIKEGDVIIKVAQATGDPVDVQGMRMDKAIELIRGKKGTEVKLTMKKIDNSIKVVSLIRDVIQLQDTYAHDAVIDNGDKKIGYIRLPEFYTDFNGTGSRTCSEDVKIQLKELEKENVKGVILDLRDNGGGSLADVIKMVGLFIKTGPVVQVRGRDQRPQIDADNDSTVVYNGPLLVLINGYSASASEIFAAAIQDYKRGIIMGSTSYGKGTVQQFFNLDDYVAPAYASYKPLGSIKITVSKFYRIDGGSTQRDGVTPDIALPDAYESVYEKEKDSEYPINWDKISPAPYHVWNNPPNMNYLRNETNKLVDQDSAYTLIKEEEKAFKKQKENTTYSLNIDEYRKQEKEHTDQYKKFEAINKPRAGVLVSSDATQKQYNEGKEPNFKTGSDMMMIYATGEEAQKMKTDSTETKLETQRLKLLTKDAGLFVAIHILGDVK
jgi:carboxyl-terminal processing protease